jgi:hypothetical protein
MSIIQGNFENCADILTIEPIIPYTNVDIFRKKEARSFSKQV